MKKSFITICLIFINSICSFAQIDSNLMESIKNNDLAKLDSLIATKVNLNTTDENDVPVLMWACYYSNSRLVSKLFQNGAVPSQQGWITYTGKTSLDMPVKGQYGNLVSIAAGRGDTELLDLLINQYNLPIDEQPIHPNIDSISGWTALMHAVLNEKAGSILYLLENSANTSLVNKLGKSAHELTQDTILSKAVESQSIPILKKLALYQKRFTELETNLINGKTKEALVLAQMNDTIIINLYGVNHPRYVFQLILSAVINSILGEYETAINIYQDALELCEKTLDQKHVLHGYILNNLGQIYISKGKYKEALPLVITSLGNTIAVVGKNHADYAYSLSSLGAIYLELGRYDKAEPIYKEAIETMESINKQNDPAYGAFLNNLASLYHTMGFFEEALVFYQKALDNTVISVGKEHSKYGIRVGNIGLLYNDIGQYEKALSLNLEALNTFKNSVGEEHFEYGRKLSDVGYLYGKIGFHKKEHEILETAKVILGNSLGKDNPTYGECLSNLSESYIKAGDFEKGIELLKEYEKIIAETNGAKNYKYGIALNNLATAYKKINRYQTADTLFQKSMTITKDALGENHPLYCMRLNNLALLYREQDQYEKALPFAQQALTISDSILDKTHFDYCEYLSNNAILNDHLKNIQTSKKQYLQLLKSSIDIIQNNFSYFSAKTQKEWKKNFELYHDQISSFYIRNGFDIPKDLINFNIYLNNLIGSNHREFSKLFSKDEFKEWLVLKRQIGIELSKNKKERNELLASWVEETNKLEFELLQKYPILKNQTSNDIVSTIKNSLKEDEAMIEINKFNLYDINQFTDTVIYIAYLITPDNDSIFSVPLFDEELLLKTISKNNQLNVEINNLYTSRGLTPGKKQMTENLSFIWAPLLPHLEKYNKLYISQSGLLNKINLAAIPINKDSLIADRFEIVQYNNFRSKIIDYSQEDKNDALLIGGIDYDYIFLSNADSTAILASRGDDENFQNLSSKKLSQKIQSTWVELPGAKKEVQNVNQLLEQKNFKTTLLTKSQATEATIKAALNQKESPRVLHFSTHGFFYPSITQEEDDTAFKTSDNPMIRSGLILSGANYAWEKGVAPTEEKEDGILTAYEVANLNLSNTELVVLSACETGLGDIQGSEGVIGLQRAFKIAGARYIIMSLWQVPDEATQRLMTKFYTNWLDKKMDIRTAFNQAQKSMRSDYDDPYSWAGFILIE